MRQINTAGEKLCTVSSHMCHHRGCKSLVTLFSFSQATGGVRLSHQKHTGREQLCSTYFALHFRYLNVCVLEHMLDNPSRGSDTQVSRYRYVCLMLFALYLATSTCLYNACRKIFQTTVASGGIVLLQSEKTKKAIS